MRFSLSADLAPLTPLSDEQLLDNLQAEWHNMDDSLRKALGLDVSSTALKAVIAKVCSSSFVCHRILHLAYHLLSAGHC